MRFLHIILVMMLLISCGGGGSSLPPTATAPGEINILGEWKVQLTIPECPTLIYTRLFTFDSVINDSTTLSQLTESGEFPDLNNVAACIVITNQIATPLSPYHVNQLPIQFKEMLSLKLGWVYDRITIKEYTTKKIVIARTVNFNNTGDRIWTYTISRIPPLTEVSESILLTGEWNASITMPGCTQTYSRVLRFNADVNDTTRIDSLNTSGTFPETNLTGRCTSKLFGTVHTFPTGYPVKQTVAQFKEMMEVQTWDKVVIDTWTQTNIILIRNIIGNTTADNAEVSYTLTRP